MSNSFVLGAWVFGFLLSGFSAFAQQPKQTPIERIDIRGNRRIPEDNIRFHIQSRPGEPYDEARLEFDLRALHKADYFENIVIEERMATSGKSSHLY
jgi:outer membrane protein assembly factor BamA